MASKSSFFSLTGPSPTLQPAAINIPVPVPGNAGYFIRINLAGTAYETQTPAQVQTDLGLDLALGDIRRWGAKGGVFDDTAAINAAFASGVNPIYIPPLTFRVTSLNAPPSNLRIVGSSEFASILQTTSATAELLPLTNGGVTIEHVGFSSSVPRTGGAYVHFRASNLTLEHFGMTGAYTAIAIDDGTSITRIDAGSITNSVGLNQPVVLYGSGTAVGPAAAYFGHVVINSSTPAYTSISVVNLADLTIDDVQSLNATFDLAVAPGTGQVVSSLSVRNSWFDHGGTNVLLSPTGTGQIVRTDFADTWMGTSTTNSIVVDGGVGSATIDGVQFINCRALASSGSGLVVQNRTKNVSWLGGFIVSSVNGVFDNRSSGWNGLIIKGATIGASNGMGGNTTGISRSGAGDYALIEGNNLLGNGTAYTSSNTGTKNRVNDNLGYNPVGNVVPAVGASPWTYTAPEVWSDYYSFGGTISSITVNGTALFTSAGSPLVIPLAPNDVVVTTYTVAPTVNVQRH